jgi:MFS family permease
MVGSRRVAEAAPAVAAVASVIAVAFMGSVIVTPLYPLYQRAFGFSDITLTLVYATYAVGNLLALLVFGQVSDQVGRKRVVLPALGLAAASALLFLFARGTAWLYLGRLTIGLAVGILSGTATAWLAEQYGADRRATATVTAATANLCGIALGPLLAGLLAQYAPAPLTTPLLAYLLALAVVVVAVARTAENRAARPGRLRVRPRIGVPRAIRGPFAAPAVTGFAIFALGGLYFALIPGVVRRDLHQAGVAVGGLVVFAFGVVAAAAVVLGRGLRPLTAMTAGLVCLLPAVALVVAAQALRSLPLLLAATALGGVALALGYRGSLEVVNRIAPDDRRAEVVSAFLLACFIGNSLPVIGVGVLTTLTDPLRAGAVFAATIAAFALVALAFSRNARRFALR